MLAPERVAAHLALSSPSVLYGGSDLPPRQVERFWYPWYFQTAVGEKALRTDPSALGRHIWRSWSPGWRFGKREFDAAAAHWNNPQFAAVVLGSDQHRWGNSLGRPAYAALQDRLGSTPKATIAGPALYGYGTDDHCVLPEASKAQRRYSTGWYERAAIANAGHFHVREQPWAVAQLFGRLWKKARLDKR